MCIVVQYRDWRKTHSLCNSWDRAAHKALMLPNPFLIYIWPCFFCTNISLVQGPTLCKEEAVWIREAEYEKTFKTSLCVVACGNSFIILCLLNASSLLNFKNSGRCCAVDCHCLRICNKVSESYYVSNLLPDKAAEVGSSVWVPELMWETLMEFLAHGFSVT